MKNVVFWDINPSSYPPETRYVSATESNRLKLCKIEVFTAMTMKNAVGC
jgi:hypothetical protein